MVELKKRKEIDPYKHNKCYELMDKAFTLYSKNSITEFSYNDLDLIYLLTIGTWKSSINNKISKVKDSNLDTDSKDELIMYLEEIEKEEDVGMFGTGFFTFNKPNSLRESEVNELMEMLIQLHGIDDEDQAIQHLESNLTKNYSGVGLGTISQILHCLKPYYFPILNSTGRDIYRKFGIEIEQENNIINYAKLTKRIKKFRDENFEIKNYRVFDMEAYVENIKEDEFIEEEDNDHYGEITRANRDFTINNDAKYWLYSPGENADYWDEFYKEGILAIGWDDIGDFKNYQSKDDIVNKLQSIEETTSSKKNDATAIFEFKSVMSQGDVIIVKKGRKELIGFGIVKSDYYFDTGRNNFKNCREVDWKEKGSWKVDHNLVLKTLTDITSYESEDKLYSFYYEKLMSLMLNNKFSHKRIFKEYLINEYGDTNGTVYSYIKAIDLLSEKLGYNMFEINDLNKLEILYLDVLKEQKSETNKYINEEAPSYAKNHFYSAALKKYINFLKNISKKRGSEYQLNAPLNQILYGPPGTGKTYNSIVKAVEIVENREIESYDDALRLFNEHLHKTIEFITFHQNYSYEDFIQGLRPETNNNSSLVFHKKDGVFKRIADKALENLRLSITEPNVKANNYVIIIDEINRANISRVFGELITLIEPDKRSHGKIPMEVILPSGDIFIVPSNLYIIGTMNTADKSIALLDIALRRRFEFESMYPVYEIQGHEIKEVDVLKKINKKIVKSKGHDFQIGHSYFMNSHMSLVERMNKKVIPLLLEYFMNDENEVRDILSAAGLELEDETWPLKIKGRKK